MKEYLTLTGSGYCYEWELWKNTWRWFYYGRYYPWGPRILVITD